ITLLAIKSTLDGVTAIVFAATLGWGVILSAVSVLVVQGSLTLVAFLVHAGLSDLQTAELTAAGGIAVLGIAVGLLELRQIKVANFLPALVVAPTLAGMLDAFGALWRIDLGDSDGEVSGGRWAEGRLVRRRAGAGARRGDPAGGGHLALWKSSRTVGFPGPPHLWGATRGRVPGRFDR